MSELPNLRRTQWLVLLRHRDDPERQRIYRESTAVCNRLVAQGLLDGDVSGYVMNGRGRDAARMAVETLESGARVFKPVRMALAELDPFKVLFTDPDADVRTLATEQLRRDTPLSCDQLKQLAESEFPCQRVYAAGRTDVELSWFEDEHHPDVVRRLAEKHPEWLDDRRIGRLVGLRDRDLLAVILDVRASDPQTVRMIVETHLVDDLAVVASFARMRLHLTDDEVDSILWHGDPRAVERYLECFDGRWETSERLVDHWIALGDPQLLRVVVTGPHSITLNDAQLARVVDLHVVDDAKLMARGFGRMTVGQFETIIERGGPGMAVEFKRIADVRRRERVVEPSARLRELLDAAGEAWRN